MSDIDSICKDNNLKPVFYNDKCDIYDYLIAVACGAIAGMVDIFLVGAPGDSKLQIWTDKQVDKTVRGFAKACGWSPREGKEKNVASAIGFLEKKFPVNYDQRNTTDVGGSFKMGTKNHHMKSLSHSPDIIGLFFSILNQFTSTSSFLSGGKIITIKSDTYELQGNDFISKLFCGVANWFGHIMSDVAGSSSSKIRGCGVAIPFFELFQMCEFGSFQIKKNRVTFATLATKVFQKGYDTRFGITMAIPVAICDLSIKLIWAIKHYYYHKKPLLECIPTQKHDELRIMLILGNGTLCLMDGAHAVMRSGGNPIIFCSRLNIVAWYRLVSLVFREVCIRQGISFPLQKELDAYIRINEALTLYLAQFEQIDIELFKEETAKYNKMVTMLECTETEEELNIVLRNEYRNFGIELPYNEEFDDFMKNNNSVLEFK